MMRIFGVAGIAATLSVSVATCAMAQTVGLGTTKGGANATIGAGVASVVSKYSGLQMRTEVYSETDRAVTATSLGKLDFGVGNVSQIQLAIEGRFVEGDRPSPNVALVATLQPFLGALLVRDDSGIRSLSDLKGRHVAGGFASHPLSLRLTKSILANGGLTFNDVVVVPASRMPDSWDLFKQGKVDGVLMGVGAGAAKELEATVGKLRYVSWDDSPNALAKVQSDFPGAYFFKIEPTNRIEGLQNGVLAVAYDYTVWAGKHVPADVVYKVTKALHEHADELKEIGPVMSLFKPKDMARKQVVPYHPGAAKYYQEVGMQSAGN